ncbi:MAG: barstar family protein [Planctomycetota bacterium]|jgi:RNAse (barnase) inhibitor barstar
MKENVKTIIIDGNNFSNMNEFYTEVEKNFCKDFKMGRNLDAFVDVLSGGFGVFEYEENINLIWKNSEKSKNNLGPMFETLIEIVNDSENVNLTIE